MALNGYEDDNGYNGEFQDDATKAFQAKNLKAVLPPFRTPIAWEKTPQDSILSSGTTDGTTTDKLVDSGADFVSDNITAGMIVENTTDNTFAIVDAVDDLNTLSLRADLQAGKSSADVFVSGEGYKVYLQFELSDAYYEYNGQTISNASSPWNGKTLPDLNETPSFLRGNIASGGTGGSDTHTLVESEMPAHTHDQSAANTGPGAGTTLARSPQSQQALHTSTSTGGDGAHNNLPAYFGVVWIGRFV